MLGVLFFLIIPKPIIRVHGVVWEIPVQRKVSLVVCLADSRGFPSHPTTMGPNWYYYFLMHM